MPTLSCCGSEQLDVGIPVWVRFKELPDMIEGCAFGLDINAVLLLMTGGLFSSGGVTSKPERIY